MKTPADRSGGSADRLVVASYCATFLKPEMLHIYRQITGLRRVQPVVFTPQRENRERFPFEAVQIVPKPWWRFFRRIWYRQLRDVPWQISKGERRWLLDALTRRNAALLHIYFGHVAVHLLPLMTSWHRPVVVSFHGADVMVDLEKRSYREATARMLRAARMVLVRSESLRRVLQTLAPADVDIRVHRTGIPLDRFPFRERSVPPKDGAWRFVQACRLIEKKGLHVTLKAFARVLKVHPAARLTIAGDGPLQTALEQLAAELGISHAVTFTGFISQEELTQLFYEAHAFVHPSEIGPDGNQEGVPNSMLEAMATGLPVFATMHGGIPEAVEPGVSGHLVREGDANALAEVIVKSLAAPESLAHMGRAAAEAVARGFDRDTQVRMLEEFYLEALNG